MEKFLWVIPFAVVGVASVITYVAVTQGLPAAWSMVSGWWNKGKSEVTAIKADVAAVKADIEKIKQKVGGV